MLPWPMGTGISRRKLFKAAIGGAAALAGLDALAIEPRWFDVTEVTLPIRDLGAGLDGYRIALLSDFHLPVASQHRIHRALASAAEFKPELIAMPGDFVDGKRGQHRQIPMPEFRGIFDPAQAPDGVVGTLGNHDHWLDADAVREQIALHTPIRLIENEHILIERDGAQLAVGGVGDLWHGILMPGKAFHGVPDSVPRILLSHNPDYADDMIEDVRIDLQLSGHTHGGQLRVPFGPAPVIPSKYGNKFREGLVQGRKNLVYVTRGVVTLHHARFWCRPEVTCLTLRSA